MISIRKALMRNIEKNQKEIDNKFRDEINRRIAEREIKSDYK